MLNTAPLPWHFIQYACFSQWLREMALQVHLSISSKPSTPQPPRLIISASSRTPWSGPYRTSRHFKCSAGQAGFFTRLGRLIKEKAKSDVEKIFSGFSKTRDNLAVIDELLLYWNLADTDRVLDELEEVTYLALKFTFVFSLVYCILLAATAALACIALWELIAYTYYRVQCGFQLGVNFHCRLYWCLISGQESQLRLWRVCVKIY